MAAKSPKTFYILHGDDDFGLDQEVSNLRSKMGDDNGDLNTSEFPLQTWNPDAAALIASNITRFVDKQRYSKTTQPEVLQPLLNRVVKDSERLTILIFCDGDGKFTGTPYDDPINKVLADHSAEQKKAKEPIMIVLRSQLGEYVGAGASLPPRPVNVPEFPPLPKPPPPPPPKQTNAPAPPPVVMGEPLIIIGKKPPVSTPAPPPTNPPPVVPEAVPELPTNAVNEVTNPVVAQNVEPAVTNLTLAAASSRKNSGSQMASIQRVCLALFGAAFVLGLGLILRPRRKGASLITRSMDDRR